MRSEGLASVLMAGFAVWLAGCRGAPPAGRPPTRVVSVSPREGAVDIDPRAHAQIHFSTGFELSTIAADAIRLLGPDSAPVPGRLGFAWAMTPCGPRPRSARRSSSPTCGAPR